MPLQKLQFRPGIQRDTTGYSAEGGWTDCDKIRFRLGYPEKIGGWTKYTSNTYLGAGRSLHNWVALDGSDYLGLGTHLKYYIEEGQDFNDITPIRLNVASGGGSSTITFDPFTTTTSAAVAASAAVVGVSSVTDIPSQGVVKINNEEILYQSVDTTTNELIGLTRGYNGTTPAAHASGDNIFWGTIAVDHVSHGSNPNDYVTFSGVDSNGLGASGNATQARLEQEFRVIAVESGDRYLIDLRDDNTSNPLSTLQAPVQIYLNANDTGDGGTGVGGAYQINVGLNSQVGGTGWGAGTWGRGGWGSAAPGGLTTATQIRIWSEDNFGEDLIINPRDAGVYYWDKTNGLGTRAVNISTLSGASDTPTVAKQVLVSDQDRHVIAFGCNPLGSSVQDPLLIRFSAQENAADWTPTTINTAGDLLIGAGSEFVQAVETKREILVWTDASLHSMRFIGPPFTFGIQQLASGITIMGPNAATATEDYVFWMGIDNFYVYAGQTKQLPCTVKDLVFNDFNFSQADKVTSGVNSEYSEVIWFYPSNSNSVANGGDGENDKYVVYNYAEELWYFGSLRRTAWLDRSTRTYPIAIEDGYLYNHEFGYDADGQPMDSFIQSAPMDIGDGHQFSMISKVIPDMTFLGSTNLSNAQATMEIQVRNSPGEAYQAASSGNVIRSVAAPIEQYTEQLNLRARGRSFSLKVSSSAPGTKWKLGSPRIDIRPDGRR